MDKIKECLAETEQIRKLLDHGGEPTHYLRDALQAARARQAAIAAAREAMRDAAVAFADRVECSGCYIVECRVYRDAPDRYLALKAEQEPTT